MKLTRKGFTTLEMLLVVIILAIIGFTGYYVYNSKQQTDKTLNSAQNETSAVKVSKKTNSTNSSQQYLVIKELNVKFPISGVISDAYYTANKANDGFSLRVHSLDTEPMCTTSEDSLATIFRLTVSDYNQQKNVGEGIPSNGVTINNYYYFIDGAQYQCAQSNANATVSQNARAAFIDASPKIQAD